MSSLEDAVSNIYQRGGKYHYDAYFYLKEALDYTMTRIIEKEGKPRHVDGAELLFGFRDYTLSEFGPMSMPLLKEWGITKTRDIGEMVYHFIEEAVFTKQEGDSCADFDNVYTFKDAFVTPFVPTGQSD